LSLNFITSSIIIRAHFLAFGKHNSRNSQLLFFIQSIKIKSKKSSFSLGISSRAFHKIAVIRLSTLIILKFSKASLYDFGEKSIVVKCQLFFFNSIAKFIPLNQFAVPISSIFLVFEIFIKSLKNLTLISLTLGTVFLSQYSLKSFKNNSIFIFFY